MSSFKDAPADLKEAARSLVENYGSDLALLEGAVVGALLAERERCAMIADAVLAEHRVSILARGAVGKALRGST